MNDLLVSFLTMLGIFAILYIRRPAKQKNKIKYRQTHIHQIISPFIPSDILIEDIETQAKKRMDQNTIHVLVNSENAYWVHKNVFYEADVLDGEVDRSTTRPVDVNNLSKEDLSKMLKILDYLNKGKNNEGRGTRNE